MATLNLFQIVSKQLKEVTHVSLEDTHKQLDMVRGGSAAQQAASTEPGWFSTGSVKESTRNKMDRARLLHVNRLRITCGWGVLLGLTPGVSDSVGLR